MSKENNPGNNLFNNLESFGLSTLDNLDIFSSKEEETLKKVVKNKQAMPENAVFERKVVCPVCNRNITVKAVKTSAVRVISRDTDFMTVFQDPNPLFYDAWLCTNCGYASLSTRFNMLSEKQSVVIKEKISSRWQFSKVYPALYTADTAIEMHQLALVNAIVKSARDSEKAMICLKLGWLHRYKEDSVNEQKFLKQALQGFESAFGKEPFPISGMDSPSLQYLIGELYRRTGDNRNALLWYGRVISDRNAKPKIKEMARDQKDTIKDS